jgi:uncharacterized membrane protein
MHSFNKKAAIYFGLFLSVFFIIQNLFLAPNFSTSIIIKTIIFSVFAGIISGIIFGFVIGKLKKM